jgi:hypothetical protein
MSSVLPPWSDDFAGRMARHLGMPPGSDWAIILPAHAPQRGAPTPFLLRRASDPPDTARRFTVAFEELEAAEGLDFQVFGRVVDTPSTPLYWPLETTRTGGPAVEVWAVAVAIGSTMRAELVYDPAAGRMRRRIEIEDQGDEWERDVPRIKRAVRALRMQMLKHGRGRPRGTRKGRLWTRQDYLDWYAEAGQTYANDGERLTLKDLGDAMGVSDDTAAQRLRDPKIDLPWPPDAFPDIWEPDD